jgi:hypothetical protein
MKRTVALLTCMALMIPGAAVASANSTTSNYGHHTGVKSVTSSRHSGPSSSTTPSTGPSTSVSPTTAATTTQTGSLPFTGLDVGGLAAGAVLLLGSGLALRRVSAKNRS